MKKVIFKFNFNYFDSDFNFQNHISLTKFHLLRQQIHHQDQLMIQNRLNLIIFTPYYSNSSENFH